MKILAYSDAHLDDALVSALTEAAAEADIVIGAGDFAQRHDGLESYMAMLEPLASKSVYVPGNNETHDALCAATSATVLHGGTTQVGGLMIAGIGAAVPPLPPELPWPSFDLTEDEAEAMLDEIDHADILVSHSPPKGVGDALNDGRSLGSVAVLTAAKRLKPRLLLCGHVHDSWGVRGRIGETEVANLGPSLNWFEV